MVAESVRGAKELLRAAIPDTALDAYRMARWRISARGSTRGADRWGSFKNLAFQQRAKGVEEYARFLRRADPSLKLPELRDARFIGEGYGAWSLNVYRVGRLNGKCVFEKIYFSASDALRKVEWFHDTVFPHLDTSIKTPSIVLRVHGVNLTALYFSFVDLGAPISVDTLLSKAIEIQHAVSDFEWNRATPAIHDFRRNNFYLQHQVELLSFLSSNGYDTGDVFRIESWLQRIEMPHRFNHGDLSVGNALICGTLLDFDSCGFYPFGYDFGMVLRQSQTPTSVKELEVLVEQQLAPDCTSSQLSILFFMTVFSSISVARKNSDKLDEAFLINLWDRVLQRLDEESAKRSNISPTRK